VSTGLESSSVVERHSVPIEFQNEPPSGFGQPT
jgi:hypothetical protein